MCIRDRSSTLFTLNGLRFHFDGLGGQKTGAFLDQRENYAAAARYAHGDALASPRDVQRKSSLIGETVERVSVSVPCGGGVVLALVEEGAGLLPAESVEVEAEAVQSEEGAGSLAAHQLRLAGRQLLQFANVGIDALDDAGLGKVFGDCVENRLPQVLAIESLS